MPKVDETDSTGSIAVMAAPLIALSIIDAIMLLFGLQRWVLGDAGRLVVMYGHFLFAPGAAWVVFVASKLGSRGWVVGLSSLVAGYLVICRFRGPWVWQGQFDYWRMTQQPWVLSAFVGIAFGITYSLGSHFSLKHRPRPPHDLRFVAALGISGVVDFAVSSISPIESAFPPTLHIAIGAITVLLSIFWLLFVRSEATDEKGIYAH